MKSKLNLFFGILLLVFGFVLLFRKDVLCIIDFLCAIINLVIFYFENKKE